MKKEKFITEDFFKNPKMILAPMAGVTDFAFRYIASNNGADLTVSEMVSVKALTYNSKNTEKLLYSIPSEKFQSLQLFGHDCTDYEKVLQKYKFENYDIIDINCGCPAPKIVKNNDGSAMMRNIKNVEKIINTVKKNTDKTVSIKFRKGIDSNENYLDFGKMCEDCGADFVTLHGRSREQFYSGTADIEATKKLSEYLSIPVIANGDILNSEDIEKYIDVGASAIMIGRASFGEPHIFAKLKNSEINSLSEIASLHLNLLKNVFENESTLVNYFKKHLVWYTKGKYNASVLRPIIFSMTRISELEEIIHSL